MNITDRWFVTADDIPADLLPLTASGIAAETIYTIERYEDGTMLREVWKRAGHAVTEHERSWAIANTSTEPLPQTTLQPRPNDVDFHTWAVRRGYQRFYQPRTVAPDLMNAYGWINAPTTGDLVIPLYSLPGDAEKTMYWHYESIVTRSTTPLRLALEGNFAWDPATGTFPDDGWEITTGYVVRDTAPHQLDGTLIKTRPGEAMRLRAYASAGVSNDFYFKFIGLEVPFVD